MFGFGKSDDSGLSKKLIKYLTMVDELYMRAYGIRTSRALYDYLSTEAIQKVNKAIFQLGGRYFGTAKFRSTTWSIISEMGTTLILLKDVKFDKVRVGSTISVAVADNYSEEWTVDLSNKDKPIVTMIQDVRRSA